MQYMKRKEFDELTIADDFMFGAVMSNKRRCKRLLEKILGIKIKRIEYPERQKVMDFSYETKSIRLDIYVEDENGTVYDIEMQTTDKGNLELRVRYYHDMIDLNIIDKGEDYRKLKNSFVIFICTYDPFGKDRYKYTFKRRCEEDETLYLEDNAVTIVLNCSGHIGDIDEDLKDLLHYIAGKEPQGEFAGDIAKGVEEVRSNKKWRRDYMTLRMMLNEERAAGRELGAVVEKITVIRKNKGKYPDELIRTMLDIDEDVYDAISELIDANPDWSDEEIAGDILGGYVRE